MAKLFVIPALLLLLADAYIFFGVLRHSPLWARLLFLIPTLVYYPVIINAMVAEELSQSILNHLLWLTLGVMFPIVIFALISLVGRGLGLIWHPLSIGADIAGAVAALAWLAIAVYGSTVGWKRITVEDVSLSSPGIPSAFDGYRIVQLSDFHIGTYATSPQSVDRIVQRVNDLHPDVIVFTGDLVNSHSAEAEAFAEALGRLKAPDGVYSVLGNHDYCLYRTYTAPDSPAKELQRLTDIERKCGWRMLRNESIQLRRGTDSIALLGVDNAGGHRFTDESDLPRALSGLPRDEYKILLSHDPSHWRREVLPASDIDLTLSGHTHAMQFKIGDWSPSSWTYREWGGLYDEGGRKLYVSTGIGENIAFRFGAYPQIVLLTLHSGR